MEAFGWFMAGAYVAAALIIAGSAVAKYLDSRGAAGGTVRINGARVS